MEGLASGRLAAGRVRRLLQSPFHAHPQPHASFPKKNLVMAVSDLAGGGGDTEAR
jgi:hypothetical protein